MRRYYVKDMYYFDPYVPTCIDELKQELETNGPFVKMFHITKDYYDLVEKEVYKVEEEYIREKEIGLRIPHFGMILGFGRIDAIKY